MRKSELEIAIKDVLGERMGTAMLEHTSLPQALQSAGAECFIDDRAGTSANFIREGMRQLRDEGQFSFEEEGPCRHCNDKPSLSACIWCGLDPLNPKGEGA